APRRAMTTVTPAPADAPPAGRRQELGAADRALLGVDRTLRRLGAPGFETQTLVWLAGPIDVGALRTGVERFGALHPLAAARLCQPEAGRGPSWPFRPGRRCPLEESWLESSDPPAVVDHAARLLSTPVRLEEADPIRFHLLHRPDGRDVLL